MISTATEDDVFERLRARVEEETRLDLVHHPLRASFEAGTLTLEGELESIAQKKKVLKAASTLPEVAWLVDRLRVAPAERMTDAQIRDHVCNALRGDTAFARCAIYAEVAGERRLIAEPVDAQGEITVIVEDGVVTLDGELPSRAHERLAGVLAWWVPGSRDVIDGLAVVPPEQDSDEEITEAVRVALEKDPFVDATQIRVATQAAVVTLTGWVPSAAQGDMAENDAWFVFGVSDVVNRIEVG